MKIVRFYLINCIDFRGSFHPLILNKRLLCLYVLYINVISLDLRDMTTHICIQENLLYIIITYWPCILNTFARCTAKHHKEKFPEMYNSIPPPALRPKSRTR